MKLCMSYDGDAVVTYMQNIVGIHSLKIGEIIN